MKAHYDTWWAFVHDGRQDANYKNAMSNSNDFIRVTEQAHYTAAFVYFAHFYDNRKDTSSIPTYLSIIKAEVNADFYNDLVRQFEDLRSRAKPILKIRHKLIAHIDNQLSESDVFDEIGMTWNEIGKVLHDTVEFVVFMAGSESGLLGIARSGRMSASVLNVLRRLAK